MRLPQLYHYLKEQMILLHEEVGVTKKKSCVKEQPISNKIFSQVTHMYNIFYL